MKSCIIVLDLLILLIFFKNGLCCDTECSFSEWKEESICHEGVAKWYRTICCRNNPHDLAKCLAACKVSKGDLEKLENCTGANKEFRAKRSTGVDKKCVPVDLVFVMDDSGSVSEGNFETMLTFASDLLNSFKIGKQDTQVGLIAFSTSARRIFNFNDYSTRAQIQTAIEGTFYTGGGTNTAAALLEARQMFISNSAKRSNALSLAIVLTDGRSNSPTDTENRAKELHNADVMVFCIGIGPNLNDDELRAIASNPDDKFLINANDFTTLHSKITQLTSSLCIDDVIPNFETCDMEIQDNNGERSPQSILLNQPTSCNNQRDFYGKYQVDRVISNITVDAEYTGSKPSAVEDFHYGITDVTITRLEKSMGGYATILGVEHITINNPPQRFVSSDKVMGNSGHLVNGERFCLLYTAKAGGYVKFGGKTYTYSDTVATKTRCYFFDSDAPQHCKILGTCTHNPVVVPSPLTKTHSVTVSFQGWEDVSPSSLSVFASGIQHYELYVHEMVSGTPGKLTMDTTPKTGTLKCEACSSFTVSLPTENQPMLYAFVLEVVDVALNARQARTFILFDSVSKVVTHPLQSLVVTSASLASSRRWQTNRGNVCYSWQNLFYNDKFVHYNPLLPIAPVSNGLIPPSYDIFPGHFSSTGTQNIHGIVNFTYTVSRESMNIYTNKAVSNVLNETICLSIPAMSDGHNISFSITAYDISLNSLTESIYHYIDSSPPFIEDAWLTKNGKSQLFVHNSTDLSKMIVEFESFDLHSGLFKIEWTFGISDNSQILGFGAIGIKKISALICSMESKCYCPVKGDCEYYNFTISLNSLIANDSHIGNHHREYFFDIKATNNAFLHKTHRLDIFVDNSPPEAGQVFDGPQDGNEVDYTDSKDILFHWQGFNDHESGIMFYRIQISNICLSQPSKSSMTHPSYIHTFDTEESEIRINVNGTGFYIATVTAFNHAYEASSPVCSDGVIYDNTPPIISTIKIQNLKMAPAIGCLNGKAWFVNNVVEKHSMPMSNECYLKCNNKTDHSILELIPNSTFSTKDWICSNVNDFEKTLFYLPSSKVRVNWTVFDNESDVMEVFIGFGSNLQSEISPDIMDFKSSPHKQYGDYFHSGLSSNSLFYVFVKVVNRAGKATIASVGPIVIDETAPVCSKKPIITIENTTLVMKWSPDSFQDLQQEEEIGVIHYRLGTSSGFSSPFLKWTSLSTPKCENGMNCIRIDVKDIRSLTKNGEIGPYYVEIQAYNYIGSFCSIKTDDIYIPSMSPPHLGELLDILPLKENDPGPYVDVAVSLNHSMYCVALLGFEFHADHKYEIGVGSLESQSNVISLHTIYPKSRNVFCENTTNVVLGQKCHVLLKATNRFNVSSIVSSNGVVFLDDADVMKTAKIAIGESCQYSETLENHTKMEFLNGSINVQFNFPLEVGERYTLFLNNVSCSEVNITGQSASILCIKNLVTFVPYIHFPNITVQNISPGADALFVNLKKCSDDIKVVRSSDHVSINWEVGHSVLHLITHFKVSLLQTCYTHAQSNCTSVKLYETNITDTTFHATLYTGQKLRTGQYVFTLRLCFSSVCTTDVFSEIIHVEESPMNNIHFESKIEYVTESACLNVELDLQKGVCNVPYPYNFAQFYRWGIFDDENGIKQLSPLFAVDSTDFSYSTVKKEKVCITLPVHIHRPLFSCVESYCASGVFSRACQQMKILTHHNSYTKDIVYDLNAYSEEILTLEKYRFSSNIGDAMKTLSALEFNFGRKTKVAGFLLNVGNRNVTWSIMKKPRVPTLCVNDPDCLSSATSIGGFIAFSSKTPLDENVLYYLCADVSPNENFAFVSGAQTKRSLCSNGFVLDNEPPVTGFVKVDNVHQGYLHNATEIRFFWHGFQDDTTYELLGYESGISKYSSCIGTSPCTDDIQKCREIGLKQWDIETNSHLTPGLTYYVGIKAFDHVGNTACASSDPFVYDPSPPIQGNVIVGHIYKHHYTTSMQRIKVFWNGFRDPESGIKSYQIGIGTTSALDDVIRFYAVGQDSEDILMNDHVVEGHIYFILLLAENHAGLKTVATSLPFLVDYSPPSLGTVSEGLPGRADMDFVSSVNFSCHWGGFEDPHSQLDHYKIGLGTYPFGSDMQPLFNIGLQNEWTWNLPLREGVKYFTTIEACNSAGLCSQATSNGIIFDETPPIPGVVFGGRIGPHLRYDAYRTKLEFQIDDFYDLHSGISHFEICVGTSKSVCNTEGKRNIRLETSGTLFNLNLPEHTEIFMILTAWNKAGLATVTSSDGIQIDTSSPILSKIPTMSNRNRYGFVIDQSFLNISWYFYDSNSPIVRQIVNVKSHHGRHVDVHLSAENALTISLKKNDWLQNGNTYYISVTACNAAELCSTAYGENFTVDSSPPHFGHFIDGTWSNLESKIELHIKNFSDSESGIVGYFVTIGGTYGSDEISEGIIYFPHYGNWNDKQQITATLSRNLTVNEKIYLSLWSSNKAGLNSTIRHFALFVSRTLSIHKGHLILEKHSCNAEYCNYDCTCSVFGDKCTDLVSIAPTCSENNVTHSFPVITVKIGIDNGNKFSLSSQCLHSQWDRNTTYAKRHEWSFGIKGRPIGFGIFDLHSEQVWHDVSNGNNVFHCLSNSRSLEHGRSYIAYLKVWWSFSDFTVFQSQPILVDLTPPSVRRGKYIVDSDGDCTKDIDYISSNNVKTCWGSVFSDQQSGIFSYKVYIGTHPGGDDVTGAKNVGNETAQHWYNLDLRRNIVYFATVEAINNLGATTTLTSDGFSIDDEPPLAGTVYTSENFRDNTWLTNENTLYASWEGFTDHGSSIVEYYVALQNKYTSGQKTVSFIPIGIKNKYSFKEIHLNASDVYVILVKAKDAAGYFSETVSSKSILVDTTEPIRLVCESYSLMFRYQKVFGNNFTTNETHFKKDRIYSITVQYENFPNLQQVIMSLGNASKTVNIEKVNSDIFFSNYSFISQFDGYQSIHIETFDVKNTKGNITIKIFQCSTEKEVDFGGVLVRQVSPSDILVSYFVADFESGISDTFINVATSRNGCPIMSVRTNREIGTHYVSVPVAHQSSLFVSVVAKNNAGKEKTFYSSGIIMDHTPPDLQQRESAYATNENNGHWDTQVNIRWNADEHESYLQFCYCAFGTVSGSENLQQWTDSSTSECVSKPLNVPHASYVYPKVRCRNSVGLAKEIQFDPVFIVYKIPDSSKSRVKFSVHNVHSKNYNNYQRFNTSLYFYWEEFERSTQLTTYNFCVKESDEILRNWTDIGRHTYTSIDGLQLKPGKVYSAEIYALNSKRLRSNALNTSVLISDVIPVQTGNSCRLENASKIERSVILTWEDVFDVNQNFDPWFTVYVGSDRNYNNVLQGISTDKSNVTLANTGSCGNLYVVIIAKYATGTQTTYREELIRPCP